MSRKIALFIDVDNTEMSFSQYLSAVGQVSAFGEIVCATVYGASERKQKGVLDDARQRGFTVQLPARSRKRVRKVFDDRIWVDATDLVTHNPNVDTVAIVAYPADMVYFFSYLRRLGLQVVGCDTLDEASLALVSHVVKVSQPDAAEAEAKASQASESGSRSKTAATSAKNSVPRIDNLGKTSVSDGKAPVASANAGSVDLVDKLDEMPSDDSDDLIEEIKKLLAGI